MCGLQLLGKEWILSEESGVVQRHLFITNFSFNSFFGCLNECVLRMNTHAMSIFWSIFRRKMKKEGCIVPWQMKLELYNCLVRAVGHAHR